MLSTVPLYVDVSQIVSVCLSMDIWVVSPCGFKSFYGHVFSFLLDKLPRGGVTDLYSRCMFNFMRNCQMSSKVAIYHITLPAIKLGSSCSTSSSALGIISTFYFSHPNMCVVVSQHGFNL